MFNERGRLVRALYIGAGKPGYPFRVNESEAQMDAVDEDMLLESERMNGEAKHMRAEAKEILIELHFNRPWERFDRLEDVDFNDLVPFWAR